MLVNMWMSREVVVVPPTMPIAQVGAELARRGVRRLPVVDPGPRGGRLVGIVSIMDLTRAFPPDVNPLSPMASERGPRHPVSTIMTARVLTIGADAPLEDAAMILLDRRIGALPVMRDAEIVGIITASDILRAFVAAMGGGTPGIRVTFDLDAEDNLTGLVAELAMRHDMSVVSVLSLQREGQRLGVVRVTGRGSDAFVDAVWQSGHRVVSVVRSTAGTTGR